jgi:hypothetical protein
MLGTPEHGRWQIAPVGGATRVTRRYRPNTLIMETRFETADGAATLIDFMPPRNDGSHLVRMVVGERGTVKLHTELVLRFGYGSTVPWVTRIDDRTLCGIAGPDTVQTYWLRAGAVAGLAGIAAQSLVEFSLQMPGNALMFVFLVLIGVATGWLLRGHMLHRNQPKEPKKLNS